MIRHILIGSNDDCLPVESIVRYLHATEGFRVQACNPVFQTPSVEASALDDDMHHQDGNYEIHNIYRQTSITSLTRVPGVDGHVYKSWLKDTGRPVRSRPEGSWGQEEIAVLCNWELVTASSSVPWLEGFLTNAAGRCSTSIQLPFKIRYPTWVPSTLDP